MSPYVFGGLLFFVFLIMPMVNIIIAVVLIIDPRIKLIDQQIESYVIFFMTLYIIRVVEFFTWIRKSIFDDARTFLSSGNLVKNKTEVELEKELLLCESEMKNDASMQVKFNQVKQELNEKASYLKK